jgi:hypothetical protein
VIGWPATLDYVHPAKLAFHKKSISCREIFTQYAQYDLPGSAISSWLSYSVPFFDLEMDVRKLFQIRIVVVGRLDLSGQVVF